MSDEDYDDQFLVPPQRRPAVMARELHKAIVENSRMIKRLRSLGASNQEIAKALGLRDDSPLLVQ